MTPSPAELLKQRRDNAIRLLLIIIAFAFLAELIIMLLLKPFFDRAPFWVEAIADSLVLAASLYPVIYFLLVDPLWKKQIREQAKAESLDQKLATLTNSLDGIAWEADINTFQFTFVSRQAERILGYPVEQWLDEPAFWAEHIHPEDREWAVNDCLECVKAGENHTFEYRMVAKDGRAVWLRDYVTVVSEGGKPVRLLGIMVDISEHKQADTSLQIMSQKYAALMESMDGIVWEADPETINTTFVSPQIERILGYSPEEWVNNPNFRKEHIHPADWDRALAECCAGISEKRNHILEYRMLAADGKEVWVRDMVTVQTEKDRVTRLQGLLVDVTEQKRMEHDLAAQKEKLQKRLAFSQAQNHIIASIATHDDAHPILQTVVNVIGDLLKVDRSLIYRVDYERRVITSLCAWGNPGTPPVARMTFPLALFDESNKYLLESWQPLESHDNNINPLLLKEGSHELLHGKMQIKSLLWIPLSDRHDHFYAFILNQLSHRREWDPEEIRFLESVANQVEIALQKLHFLDKQRASEERLRESKELLEKMFDTTHLTIAYMDGEFKFIRVNRAYAEADGKEPEFFTGRNHFDLYPNEENVSIFRKTVETGISYFAYEKPFEYPEHPEKGITYWDWSLIPIAKEKTVTGVILSLIDVTERKRLADQLRQAQKMESVGALAGGVAHDFNNLLTVIQGFSDLLLRKSPEDTPQYRQLNEIKKASLRASNLTQQLLLFSRQQPAVKSLQDMNAIIADFNKMLQRLVEEHYTIESTLSSNLNSVFADKGHLEQVIMNLVVNARDAMPEGGKILIRTTNALIDEEYCRNHAYARQGGFVTLIVQDNGIGMDSATMSRIFEPFFTTKGAGKGTGLGLAVVYGIIKQHEGWITVESLPGEGSTFRVYLPAVDSKAKVDKDEKDASSVWLKGRVLLVEDEETLRILVHEVLNDHGLEVFSAATLKEAEDVFAREGGTFDLLLSDVVLPDGSGVRMAEKLKDLKPDLAVLLSSGYSHETMGLHQALQEKKYPFLQKPYDIGELLHTVHRVLSSR